MSFLVTSVISGLLVAAGGMFWVLILALVVLTVALLQLAPAPVPHREPEPDPDATGQPPDPAPTPWTCAERCAWCAASPGLLALIGFTCFNNLLNGVFMALHGRLRIVADVGAGLGSALGGASAPDSSSGASRWLAPG